MVGALADKEKNKLLDLVLDANITLAELEKKFSNAFGEKFHRSIVEVLPSIVKEFIASCEGVGLISCVYIVNILRKGKGASPDALLFDILIELEKAIRKDMYLAEQLKYSTKEQTKEKKKGSEAAFADAYRIHNSVKVFLFDILADGVKKDEKPEFFLRKSVDELNTELEGLEKNPEKLKAPIGNLSQKWCTEKEKSITGSLLGEAAIVESEANKKTALIVNLPQCPLPTTPVSAGEVFFLLPGSNPFVLSNKPINATWKQARKMLEEAQKAPLNAEKSEKMLNLLNDPGVRHIGIDGSVLRNLATHNPEICGSLLSKLPNNEVSEHVQSFIKGGVASDNIEKIMTKTSKLLEQINIRTYVGEIINQFKEKSLTAADKEILKRFCNFLHQLISQHSKENKELYIPDAVKKDLESIFKSCDNAEVLNKWNEMNKK